MRTEQFSQMEPDVEIRPIDPRSVFDVVPEPAYRVIFWGQVPVGSVPDGDLPGFVAEELRIEGARDVTEVLAWAKTNARGRTAQVYVEHPVGRSGSSGLLRLYGPDDPTAPVSR